MHSKIIYGSMLAEQKYQDLKIVIDQIKDEYNIIPAFAILLVGKDPASLVYIKNKLLKAEQLGIKAHFIHLDEDISQTLLEDQIKQVNNDPEICGMIIQLPLPKHIDEISILNMVSPEKDIDGFNAINVGLLHMGKPNFVPCTPLGCLALLKANTSLKGKKAVIVGRSNIVGKPLSALLLNHDATVTICHSHTINLKEITREADIVVTAIGKPKFFTQEYFKENAILIDVGINRVLYKENFKLVGDIDFENVISKIKFITPVPGGVGPMTIIYLMRNIIKACIMQNQIHINFEI